MSDFSWLNRRTYYILDAQGEPVPVDDVLVWAQWFEAHDDARRVALTETENGRVSTMFLGLDHNYFGDGPPLLYETMVFGGTENYEMDRYSTKAEALAGHWLIVAMVQAAVGTKRDA